MNKKRYKGSGFLNYRYSAQICYVSFDISWNFVMEAIGFLTFMFFDVFDLSWPTKNLFCDTSGTAAGHFYRFGTLILVRMIFVSLLRKVAYAIRSRLCRPNTHFTLNSDTFFWTSKIAKDRNGFGSQARHLRHITDKGGTGRRRHLRAIWRPKLNLLHSLSNVMQKLL